MSRANLCSTEQVTPLRLDPFSTSVLSAALLFPLVSPPPEALRSGAASRRDLCFSNRPRRVRNLQKGLPVVPTNSLEIVCESKPRGANVQLVRTLPPIPLDFALFRSVLALFSLVDQLVLIFDLLLFIENSFPPPYLKTFLPPYEFSPIAPFFSLPDRDDRSKTFLSKIVTPPPPQSLSGRIHSSLLLLPSSRPFVSVTLHSDSAERRARPAPARCGVRFSSPPSLLRWQRQPVRSFCSGCRACAARLSSCTSPVKLRLPFFRCASRSSTPFICYLPWQKYSPLPAFIRRCFGMATVLFFLCS